MKKKIIIILIIALIVSGGVIGYDLLKISVNEANKIALENDQYLEIDNLNLQAAAIDYDNALRNAKISSKYSYSGEMTSYYTPFMQETNLNLTKMSNEKNMKLIEKQVLSLSYDYYINKGNYESSLKSYQKAVDDYNSAKKDSETTALEIMQYEYSMKALKINSDIQEATFSQTKNELFKLLNDEQVADVTAIVIKNPYDIDFNQVWTTATDYNSDLYSKKRNKEAQEILFSIVKKYYKEDTSNYISALANKEKAKLDYDSQIESLKVKIINDIENLKTKYDYVELEMLNNSIKKNDYDIAKSQYDNGFISLDSLDSKKSALDASDTQLIQKKRTYILALKDFEIYTGFTY
ncbi:MAG: TolC family protein [Clostridia bacterium]|nr:TolC family protein [Clostridia bacterium]